MLIFYDFYDLETECSSDWSFDNFSVFAFFFGAFLGIYSGTWIIGT